MTSTTSRFATLTRWQAMAVVASTLLIMAYGAAFQMHNQYLPGASSAIVASPTVSATPAIESSDPDAVTEKGDLALYRAVTLRMANGAPYYATVVELHRKGNYPLRPFITVRLPTLALIGSTIGLEAARAALIALLILALVVWWMRLKCDTDPTTLQPVICVLAISTGTFSFAVTPNLAVSHEVWAGTLMAASWALSGGFGTNPDDGSVTRSQDHALGTWLPSVVLAAAAVLIRETALPFVLLMGAFAAWRRHWSETAAWAVVVALFGAALAVHVSYVDAATVPTDLPSPGWANFAGWPFFVLATHGSTGLRIMPEWTAAIAVPLTMLGWAAWRPAGHTDTGVFGFLLFAGYALIFMVLGRPDNWYWGLLISPLFLLGLMFAPQAIADLVKVICRSPTAAAISAARAPATGTQWPTTSTRPAAAR